LVFRFSRFRGENPVSVGVGVLDLVIADDSGARFG